MISLSYLNKLFKIFFLINIFFISSNASAAVDIWEKKENQTMEVLKQQLEIVKKVELNEFMIAYEPVWAIGTGNTANIDYIDKIHKEIIDEVTSYQKEGFLGVSYGGSVDSSS